MTLPRANLPPRSTTDREASARVQQGWRQPGQLPEPEPRDGIRFKWVRRSIRGEADVKHMHSMAYQGWEAATIEDCPELAHVVDLNAKALGATGATASSYIEIGGLVLMKMPEEWAQQRAAAQRLQTQRSEQAVDNDLMKEADKSMPLFRERESSVSRRG